MPKLAANAKVIEKVVNNATGARVTYAIEGHPGLYLDVGVGFATWRIRYRPTPTSNQRWYRLADARNTKLDDASKAARRLITDLRINGQDPHVVREREAADIAAKAAAEAIAAAVEQKTFGVVYREWLENPARQKELRTRTRENYENLFKRYLEPAIGSEPIASLRKDHVKACVEAIGARLAKSERANRGYQAVPALKLVRSVCRYALANDYIIKDPTLGVALPVPEKNPKGKQSRPLSGAELKAIWGAADERLGETGAALLKLSLLIGRRVSELVHAHAVEFDLDVDRPVWTIPGTREGNKSLDTYIVPLPPVAVDIIKRQLQSRARPSLYVFPARSVDDKPTSRHSPSHDFFDMCTDLGITGVRLHDSRGLIVTHMSAMGIPSEIRSHVLQHSGDMTESLADSTYNAWDFEPEKRRALSLWEARLLAIVDGRQLPADRW